jgi:hypothetical protein
MKIFNKEADLALATLSAYQYVETLGKTTRGDELAARFYIMPESSNYDATANDVTLANGLVARKLHNISFVMDDWNNEMVAAKLSDTTFSVSGNFTDTFDTDRRIEIDNGSTLFYGVVVSAVYGSGSTVVTVEPEVEGEVIPTGSLTVRTYIITDPLAPLREDSGSSIVKFIGASANAEARSVQSKLRDIVSVKDFGAVGNGVEDDSEAVQNFLNYLVTNKRKGFMPRGIYRCEQPIVRPADWLGDQSKYTANFIIEGEGRISDPGSLYSWNETIDGTIIYFPYLLTEPTGAFDISEETGDPWYGKNIALHSLTIIGTNSTGPILNTSGIRKSNFTNISVLNKHSTGSGWYARNCDQLYLENILIRSNITVGDGGTYTVSTGAGLDLRNPDLYYESSTDVDGSISAFVKVLVFGYKTGFYCGVDKELGDTNYQGTPTTAGQFQQYNTFTSCGTNWCETGIYLGDRWRSNVFTGCQFRGMKYGLRAGSRAENNTFIGCVFNAQGSDTYSTHFQIAAAEIGVSGTTLGRNFNYNSFIKCSFVITDNGIPNGNNTLVLWNNNSNVDSIEGNSFIECTFEGKQGSSSLYAFTFTDATPVLVNSNIIRDCIFSNIQNKFNAYEGLWDVKLSKQKNITTYAKTTNATPVEALIRFTTGQTGILKLTVLANASDQSCMGAWEFTAGILCYNSGGSPTVDLIDDTYAEIFEAVEGGALDCTLSTTAGVNPHLIVTVTGVAGKNISWNITGTLMLTTGM